MACAKPCQRDPCKAPSHSNEKKASLEQGVEKKGSHIDESNISACPSQKRVQSVLPKRKRTLDFQLEKRTRTNRKEFDDLVKKFSYPRIQSKPFEQFLVKEHRILAAQSNKMNAAIQKRKMENFCKEKPHSLECRKKAVMKKYQDPFAFETPDRKIRIPLPHDIDITNDYVIYNVENPFRVSVRLEYLMGTTEAKITSNEYMDALYRNLRGEEEKEIEKRDKERRDTEEFRVRKLVIDGLMDPPANMEYLQTHPVFRVNKILQRLDTHDAFLESTNEMKDNITPIEPYEFDGNKFFRHVHRAGKTWKPTYEEMKKCLRIQKIKEKLRNKLLFDLDERKDLHALYKGTSKCLKGEEEKDDDVEFAGEGSFAEALRLGAVDSQETVATTRNKSIVMAGHVFDDDENEIEYDGEDGNFESNKIFQLINFAAKTNTADQQAKFENDEVKKEVELENLYERLELLNDAVDRQTKMAGMKKKTDSDCIIDMHREMRDIIRDIRRKYNIPTTEHYTFENPIIKKYIDGARDIHEFLRNFKKVRNLYVREQAVATDFVKKLNVDRPSTFKIST